jgi:hypothetical protein
VCEYAVGGEVPAVTVTNEIVELKLDGTQARFLSLAIQSGTREVSPAIALSRQIVSSSTLHILRYVYSARSPTILR